MLFFNNAGAFFLIFKIISVLRSYCYLVSFIMKPLIDGIIRVGSDLGFIVACNFSLFHTQTILNL